MGKMFSYGASVDSVAIRPFTCKPANLQTFPILCHWSVVIGAQCEADVTGKSIDFIHHSL